MNSELLAQVYALAGQVTASHLAAPPLLVILLTALFGLNDARLDTSRATSSRAWKGELALGVSHLVMLVGSGLMLTAIVLGASIYTWRGCIMVWGVAGVFFFVGKFHPWRRWLRRTVAIERQWRNPAHPTSSDLAELVAECRRAVRYGASECLRVLPKVIAAMEILAAERQEIERIRAELVSAVASLRARFRSAESMSAATMEQMDGILQRLEKALRDE